MDMNSFFDLELKIGGTMIIRDETWIALDLSIVTIDNPLI